jgi:cytochrome P450
VICDLLGVDAAEREFLRQWTRDYGQLIYGASSHQAGYAEAVGRAGDEFYARFSAVIAAKRQQPGPDLISHLLVTSEREQWTDAELLGTCSMLLFAGHDTTSALIASSTRALMLHPESRAAFETQPALVDSAHGLHVLPGAREVCSFLARPLGDKHPKGSRSLPSFAAESNTARPCPRRVRAFCQGDVEGSRHDPLP